jgi:phage I-like protein
MKPIAVLALVLAVGIATYSAAAWSAPSATPTEQKLLKNVATLKAQVAKLQKTDKTQNANINTVANIAVSALAYSACSTAVTADAIQGTWQIVDQLSAATQAGKTYFGAQTPVSDSVLSGLLTAPACQAASVTRSQALPPTSAQFSALLGVLKSFELRHGFKLQHG